MSAQVNGPAGKPDEMPESAIALEWAIQNRRDHLAATIDELTSRAKPTQIARRGAAGAQRRFRTLTHGDDGQLRTERLVAVAAAVAVLGGVLIHLRRHR